MKAYWHGHQIASVVHYYTAYGVRSVIIQLAGIPSRTFRTYPDQIMIGGIF